MSRVDYSISDNTKLFVRYNLQREAQLFPIGLWSAATAAQVPYPTPVAGQEPLRLRYRVADSRLQLRRMTNEFVFGYTFIGFPNVFEDPTKVDRDQDRLQLQGPVQERRGADSRPSASRRRGGRSCSTQGGFEVGGPRGPVRQ